jgi:hypothetical protein
VAVQVRAMWLLLLQESTTNCHNMHPRYFVNNFYNDMQKSEPFLHQLPNHHAMYNNPIRIGDHLTHHDARAVICNPTNYWGSCMEATLTRHKRGHSCVRCDVIPLYKLNNMQIGQITRKSIAKYPPLQHPILVIFMVRYIVDK